MSCILACVVVFDGFVCLPHVDKTLCNVITMLPVASMASPPHGCWLWSWQVELQAALDREKHGAAASQEELAAARADLTAVTAEKEALAVQVASLQVRRCQTPIKGAGVQRGS
jgi:hypothetical protein